MTDLANLCAEQAATIERLREALRPFVEGSSHVMCLNVLPVSSGYHTHDAVVVCEQVYRARAALKETNEQK